jgi:hypothetical protein
VTVLISPSTCMTALEWLSRPQVQLQKGIGVEGSPVDFYAQKLLQSYIRQANLVAKVIDKGELVGLGRCLENDRSGTEFCNKTIGESKIQLPLFVEETDAPRSLALITGWVAPSSSHLCPCSIYSPTTSLVNAPAFLSQLEPDLQHPLARHSHDVLSTHGKVGEPLPALDPAHADVRARVEVGRKLALCYGYLEGSPAGNGRDTPCARTRRLLAGVWRPHLRPASRP